MGKQYKKIIVLGTGSLFLECLEYVSHLGISYEGYEASPKASKITLMQAQKRGFSCEALDKETLFGRLEQEKESTLLISAISPVILPQAVLKNEQILALNCHQALLPRHKGRNAESWAIYEGDAESGITWHKMTAQVDAGEILLQKKLPITQTMTAYELFRRQIKAAGEAFAEFMPKVLAGIETYTVQKDTGAEALHYSREMPAQGRLELTWTGEQISRFLRATDYGILKVMERPKLLLDGKEYSVKKYRIERLQQEETAQTQRTGAQLTLIRQNYKFILYMI